jgi:hypothetical protein
MRMMSCPWFRHTHGLTIVAFATLVMALPAFSQDESLTLDLATGNYRLRYLGDDDKPVELMWIPATKVKPTLKSWISAQPNDTTRYRYTVAVETGSPQPLASMSFDASQVIGTRDDQSIVNFPHGVPSGWEGNIMPSFRSNGIFVGWMFTQLNNQGTAGLQAGQKQGGFYVDSKDLPGVGTVRIRGSTPIQGFPGEGPGEREVGLKLREVQMAFVPRLAVVPLISNPNPFDAATILTSLKTHLDQDLVAMKLVEPSLVSELDRWLEAAITAAKAGNTPALKAGIKEARKLLKREYADVDDDRDEAGDDDGKERRKTARIDKLAARVLDFDLKYVEKRVKGAEKD